MVASLPMMDQSALNIAKLTVDTDGCNGKLVLPSISVPIELPNQESGLA